MCGLRALFQAAYSKKGLNTLERLEYAEKKASDHLVALLERMRRSTERNNTMEKGVINAASTAENKRWQVEAVGSLIDAGATRRKTAESEFVSHAISAVAKKGEEALRILAAWSDDSMNMEKSAVNGQLLAQVRKSDTLRDISRYLGRFREIFAQGKRNSYALGRGEKYSLELGNDLSRALSSELSMLAVPEALPMFLRRYQCKTDQAVSREPVYRGIGDMICCLDESDSTREDPSAWGKAVALTLLELAGEGGRSFALIHFSGPDSFKTDIFRPGAYTVADKLAAAEMFLGGGTSFETPM